MALDVKKDYSGPLTYEPNLFLRVGCNSGWSTEDSGSSTRSSKSLSCIQEDLSILRVTLAQDFSINSTQERML